MMNNTEDSVLDINLTQLDNPGIVDASRKKLVDHEDQPESISAMTASTAPFTQIRGSKVAPSSLQELKHQPHQ